MTTASTDLSDVLQNMEGHEDTQRVSLRNILRYWRLSGPCCDLITRRLRRILLSLRSGSYVRVKGDRPTLRFIKRERALIAKQALQTPSRSESNPMMRRPSTPTPVPWTPDPLLHPSRHRRKEPNLQIPHCEPQAERQTTRRTRIISRQPRPPLPLPTP